MEADVPGYVLYEYEYHVHVQVAVDGNGNVINSHVVGPRLCNSCHPARGRAQFWSAAYAEPFPEPAIDGEGTPPLLASPGAPPPWQPANIPPGLPTLNMGVGTLHEVGTLQNVNKVSARWGGWVAWVPERSCPPC